MNSRGNITYFYGIMLGVTIIILALDLAPAVANSTNSARNASSGDTIGLDCSNDSISNFDKATCIATDINLFYFIASLFFVGGAVITAKIIL